MTDFGIAEVTFKTALRAALIAPLALAAGYAVSHEMRRQSTAGGRALGCLLLVTLVAPDLIAGYGYWSFSLSLARHPGWNEALLTLLIGLKASVVAAVILYFSPESPLTPAGRRLLDLARGRMPAASRLRIGAYAGLVRLLPALAIAFLFAFQQFELPSLMGGTAWTVTLFDRQALVPDLSESADPLVWPLMIELVALGPVVAFLMRSVTANRRSVPAAKSAFAINATAWSVATLAALLTAAVPFGILLYEGAGGLSYLAAATPTAIGYWREVSVALAYGTTAGVAAYFAGAGILRLVASVRWRRGGLALLALACLPGLSGPLVPSLAAVELLQRPMLLPVRDTILPLIVVLTLSLLPRAILLEALARFARDQAAVHLSRRLRSSPSKAQRSSGRRLLWSLEGFGRFCRVSLLAHWGYLDLTAAAILAPTAIVPVTVRLYNLMHYGHNPSLSAMTLVVVAVPIAAFASILLLRHLSLRFLVR